MNLTRVRQTIAIGLCAFVTVAEAQQVTVDPVRPEGSIFRRPYVAAEVPPVRVGNSGRFANLIRAGKLYLTAQDAIALTLENNIDLEVSRYNRPMLEWRLERSAAGGTLPGVPSAQTQASGNTSGQGVLGSQQAAGVTGGNNGITRTVGNATITQIGPVTQTLDAIIQESSSFAHRSLPQPNATQSVTPVIVQDTRAHTASFQQGFVTGGSVTVTYSGRYLSENAPTDILNPSQSVSLAISAQHNLLQGFGAKIGGRNITVGKMNLAMSDNTFRTQVNRIVGQVLNTYYGLVADYMDLSAKQDALQTAEKFQAETARRLDLGSVAQLDVTTAQNQVAVARLNLSNSNVTLEQRQVALKNLISRTGLAEPALQGVSIVPLDSLTMPAADDIPSVGDLVKQAYATRSELRTTEANLKTTEISNLGTANGLLPSLQVFATRSTAGLGGTPKVVKGLPPADPYFEGGLGVALAQTFRQNFPTESAGVFARVTLNNRQAQADSGIDQLSLRQQELNAAKEKNQLQVDIANAVVAIEQARGRYVAAVEARKLQEKLQDAEQKKFAAGESTTYNVTQISRDLVAARSSELSALVGYRNARLNLDQSTGTLLEANHVSLAEANDGRVPRASVLPADQPL